MTHAGPSTGNNAAAFPAPRYGRTSAKSASRAESRTRVAPRAGRNATDDRGGALAGQDIDIHSLERFKEALRTMLLPNGTEDPGFELRGPVAEQNRSRLFLVQASIYPAPVAIKAFFDPATRRPEAAEAEAYFTALWQAREISREQPALRIVQPLAFLEPLGVVVMEWVEGPTLSESIITGSLPAATDLVHKAGLWLATLHRSQLAAPRPLDTKAMLDDLRESADLSSHRISSYVTRLVGRLAATAPDIGEQAVPTSLLHGDFKPDNLIVDHDRLVGIDVELCFVNAALNDVAQFQNHLYLLLHDPRRIGHARRSAALLEAFEAGYSADGGMTLPAAPLAWARLCNALRLLMGQVAGRNWVKALGAEWQLRHLIRHLTADTARR